MDSNINDFPIQNAIKENNINLAKQLILENPKNLYIKDLDDRTPLHWAVSINNTELVKFIIDLKPEVNIDEYVDLSGWSPLHISSSLGNIEILNLFMNMSNPPDINSKTNLGITPLHLSISKNHLSYVRTLINEYGANYKIKDKKGYTPLIRASSIGSIPIVQELLAQKNISVNATDNDGWTSLHHALAEGHGDCAVYLVEKGGVDFNLTNNEDLKPIQVSVDEKVAKYFKDHVDYKIKEIE
ncbi:NAS6 [Candida pseudojiufengensis]|uniref:NAS6 n=1 Tax=Candida pseudojiufengensis TaxID=497109 RepID=UPI002224ADB6|nr:NAS6 [Candida pseudojiufengensis]KAI5960980.1 NAS6 [Candida pseudojiufengensis]